MSLVVFSEAQFLTTSFATYGTAGSASIIDKVTATNVSDADVTVDICLVQLGDSANTGNTVVSVVVPSGQAYLCGEVVGHILAVGGFISAKASVAGSVVFRASGRST